MMPCYLFGYHEHHAAVPASAADRPGSIRLGAWLGGPYALTLQVAICTGT